MKVNIIYWDITEQNTEVVVNSANPSLLGWWGIDGQIHLKAWPELYEECLKIRKTEYIDWLEEWWAVLTGWYNLKAKYIIHTHWPVCYRYQDDSWKKVLEACYILCLEIAEEKWVKSISFPLISNGIFQCKVEETSIIALQTIKEYFTQNPQSSITRVDIVIYNDKEFWKKDEKNHLLYLENYKRIFEWWVDTETIFILEDQYAESIAKGLLSIDSTLKLPIVNNIKSPLEYLSNIESKAETSIILLDNYFPWKWYEEPLGDIFLQKLLKTGKDYKILCISDRGKRLIEWYDGWKEADERGWIIWWIQNKDANEIFKYL